MQNQELSWQDRLNVKTPQSIDLFGVPEEFPQYRSGVSNRTDLEGYIAAGLPVGVCITKTSRPVRALLADYASNGGMVFVDSGAFSSFQNKSNTDFKLVFSLYNEILKKCTNPGNILFVAPDVIGSQSDTHSVMSQFSSDVRKMAAMGARFIIPSHKGSIDLPFFVKTSQRILGLDSFTLGIPSKAAVLSDYETINLVKVVKPEGVHFLGLANNKSTIAHTVKHMMGDSCTITTDTTRMRSQLGEGRILTELPKELTDLEVDNALTGGGEFSHHDYTENIGVLSSLIEDMSPGKKRGFIEAVCPGRITVKELNQSVEDDTLWELLEEACFGYEYEAVIAYLVERCRREVGPAMRRKAITDTANAGLI